MLRYKGAPKKTTAASPPRTKKPPKNVGIRMPSSNFSIVDLFSDIVMFDIEMFSPFMVTRILGNS
jgi:hypothetical protein